MTIAPVRTDLVSCTIDGFEVRVPKGTLIIRAAETIGIQVPRFCDHPGLDPVGACRQCIVEVDGQRKPVASCTTPVAEGWAIKTQLTSAVAAKAQAGTMELLLINHPLDCPVCDKGGECPLQNQAMSNGAAESRFTDKKRTYPKPLSISTQVLLDRERCVLCARCTRFSEQIAGDPFIELFERGALQQVNIDPNTPFESYFSGNTVQICPVGALTGRSYRFRSRPFDTKSADSVCEHCASGCDLRTDHRNGKVTRRLAGDAPEVNGEWNCDKGRWAFAYLRAPQRLTTPLVRDRSTGELVPASWSAALELVAAGLGKARHAAVFAGGRLTTEDAHAYARFARVVLGTDDVDFRARATSAEEADFLAAHVAGTGMGVTYAALEHAKAVVAVGFEAEEESPIVFLRLRKAARQHGLAVTVVAPFATPGTTKMFGKLVRAVPGEEAALLAAVAAGAAGEALDERAARIGAALRSDGAVLLVGERLASVPGGLTQAAAAAEATGAKLAWIPRRAGERGALDVGLLPGLLPGGRSLLDEKARTLVARAWGVNPELLPAVKGAPVFSGTADAYVIGGVDLDDLPNPTAAREALKAASFVLSLELSLSSVTELADVVLPVAATAEKSGSFTDWEGRERPFLQVLAGQSAVHAPLRSDAGVLHAIASELGVSLGRADAVTYRSVSHALGTAKAAQRVPAAAPVDAVAPPVPSAGSAVLATHRMLLDLGSLQAGEENLAGTARAPRVHLSAATAASIGATPGSDVTITTPAGSVTFPLVVAPVPDGVVWAPMRSTPGSVRAELAGAGGTVVQIRAASAGETA